MAGTRCVETTRMGTLETLAIVLAIYVVVFIAHHATPHET
jgi:hypothetical protein